MRVRPRATRQVLHCLYVFVQYYTVGNIIQQKKVLNLFLSSGNKASHLAAIAMEPRGMLVAVEADAVREKLLRATLRRQLCFNVRVVGKDMHMYTWISHRLYAMLHSHSDALNNNSVGLIF